MKDWFSEKKRRSFVSVCFIRSSRELKWDTSHELSVERLSPFESHARAKRSLGEELARVPPKVSLFAGSERLLQFILKVQNGVAEEEGICLTYLGPTSGIPASRTCGRYETKKQHLTTFLSECEQNRRTLQGECCRKRTGKPWWRTAVYGKEK